MGEIEVQNRYLHEYFLNDIKKQKEFVSAEKCG